jgi:tRNA(Ser,Leu) C12 N-acetylase TAN1
MEHGTLLCTTYENFDENYLKHTGWGYTSNRNPCYDEIFSRENLLQMQKKISELLEGVDQNGKTIVVPLDKIGHILSSVYSSQRPSVGDIFSRYIQSGIEERRNDVRQIIDRSINIIVTQIKNEFETIENNKKLTIWTTVLGDFNQRGLRAHSQIKLNKRRSNRMFFFENY